MKTLTIEVPDELYQAFEQTAAREGRRLDALTLEFLAEYARHGCPQPTAEERRAARELLRCHMGAVDSGDSHSGDNERIDADLAREYSSTHEED